jgi:16S rRNA (uracil1498-N3)-methyltransferase
LNLFYHPHSNPGDPQITFEKEESRHIIKVLRNKIGDVLHITNGRGDLFEARLTQMTPKQCLARVEESTKEAPAPYRLHMAVAPTKNNDRFEWFLEKATEIGIHTITPIFCDHSERKVIKPERYEKILESAMKQSLRTYKPILAPAISFSEFITQTGSDSAVKCIAHCEDRPRKSLQQLLAPAKATLLLIGPEGDFSHNEIALAIENGFSEITLGTSRLRTETAAIVACHTVALINS